VNVIHFIELSGNRYFIQLSQITDFIQPHILKLYPWLCYL